MLEIASEGQEDDCNDGDVHCQQRRVWGAQPAARRDEILPYFVWSVVHNEERKADELKAFLAVKFA